jgi:hypothetical protein
MSQGKSKQTATQTRNVAGPSPEEALLQQHNMQAAQAQAQALQQAMQQQQQYEQSPGYQQMMGIGPQAAQGLQGLMQNGGLPSQQQQSALQQYFQSIMAPQMQQMQQTASNEAARRGMTIADSPIGGDYLRQMANYQSQMGGQQAGQGLQLGQNMGNMYQNALNFGGQLQQNANQNRLALVNAQPGGYGLQGQMAQNRIASAPTTTTQTGTQSQPFSQTLGQYGQAAQGLGQLAFGNGQNKNTGMGGLFGAFGLGG